MRAIALLAILALTLGLAPAAHAVRHGGWLVLTISTEREPQPRQRLLTCWPGGGDHPRPYTACRQLFAANGNVGNIPADPGPCTLELNPTTVTATGRWNGTQRTFARAYSNPCVANRETGGVLFDW